MSFEEPKTLEETLLTNNETMIYGQSQESKYKLDKTLKDGLGNNLMFGEDPVNNRLMVTIVDWAKLTDDGWRTNIFKTKEEIKSVINSLTKYYNQM